MIRIATASASLLPAAAMAAEARYLTGPELEQAAARVRAAGAAPPPTRLAGRRFQITVVPRQKGEAHSICSGFPSWGWHAQEGTFDVSAGDASHAAGFFLDASGRPALPFAPKNLGEPQQWVNLVPFSCRYSREPKRMAENMYGETVEHEPISEDVTAIAQRSLPSLGRSLSRWDWVQVKTDQAGGLALGERIVLRITGVLGEWSPRHSIVCGADDYSSLGGLVLANRFSGCLINGRVERIDYVDAASGEVRLSTRRKRTGRGRDVVVPVK